MHLNYHSDNEKDFQIQDRYYLKHMANLDKD